MRTYRLPQGATVSVMATRRLLDEAARYLAPHYDETSATEESWNVVATRDGRNAEGSGTVQDAFGERFELAMAGRDAWLVRHEGGPNQIWFPDRRRVEVVVTPEVGSYEAAQGVYAAVRHIGLRQAASAGLTVLHAAAVDTVWGGVLLCGEKGAGKTTLALALLAQGAAYMASDRVVAWRDDEGLRFAGWPGSFRLTPATIDVALDGAVAARLRWQMQRTQSVPHYWFGGKFRFPPGDLLDLGGWSRRTASAPRLLVELDRTISGDRSKWLSATKVEETWRRHQVHGRPLFDPADEPGPCPPPEPPSGLKGARIGRCSPAQMARRVLDLAMQAVS